MYISNHSPLRVMISQPMGHMSRDEILLTREKIAMELRQQGYEVIDTYISDEAPRDVLEGKRGLWSTGETLKYMSSCDAVYFVPGWSYARGCRVEHLAATNYGLICLGSAT